MENYGEVDGEPRIYYRISEEISEDIPEDLPEYPKRFFEVLRINGYPRRTSEILGYPWISFWGELPDGLELLDVKCASFYTQRVCDQANTALGQKLTEVCKASGLDLRHTPENECSIESFCRLPP